jgi:hypothetical protein
VQRIGQVISGIVALLLVVVGVAAVGLLFVFAVRQGSTFWAALLASAATVGAAGLVRNFERRRVADSIRRERLSDIYTEMAQVLHGREIPDDQRSELMSNFIRQTLVYASPKTLKTFRSWNANLPGGERWTKDEYTASTLRYEAFVKAMRDDLGIPNRGLADGDLARMGIADFDDPQFPEEI